MRDDGNGMGNIFYLFLSMSYLEIGEYYAKQKPVR